MLNFVLNSKIKRFILKILNVYALDKESLNLVNPDYKNVNSNYFSFNDKSIDFEIAKLYTLIKNYMASDFIFYNLIKDKDLTEEIIHHYCMNLIDWKKESQVITFLKNIDNFSETKNLLLGLANYKLNNFNFKQ